MMMAYESPSTWHQTSSERNNDVEAKFFDCGERGSPSSERLSEVPASHPRNCISFGASLFVRKITWGSSFLCGLFNRKYHQQSRDRGLEQSQRRPIIGATGTLHGWCWCWLLLRICLIFLGIAVAFSVPFVASQVRMYQRRCACSRISDSQNTARTTIGVGSDNLAKEEVMCGYPEFLELGGSLLVLAGMCAVRAVFSVLLRPFAQLHLLCTPEDKELHVERFCTIAFKFVYFLCVAPTGWLLFHEQPWFPSSMGGPHKETEGNELASLLWEKWPCIPFTMHSTIRAYYVVQLSYHLHSCVQHILRQHKAHCAQMNGGAERIDTWIKSLLRNLFKSAVSGQFDEMLLHHTVALLLIVFSYVQNMLRIGVLVFILHDTCDVLIYAEKLAVDLTRRKAVIVGVYLTLIGTWTWTRLYLFPFVILHASLASAPRVVPLAADRGARLAYATFNGLLVMLMCVHVYWTVLLVRLAWNFVIRGRLRDPHCSCNSVSGNENSKCGGESDGPCCRGTPVQGGLSVSVVNN